MSKPKVYRQINPELPTPKRDKSGLVSYDQMIEYVNSVSRSSEFYELVEARVLKVYRVEADLDIITKPNGEETRDSTQIGTLDAIMIHNGERVRNVQPLCSHFNCAPLADEKVIISEYSGRYYYSFPLASMGKVDNNREKIVSGESLVFPKLTFLNRPLFTGPGDTTIQGRYGNYMNFGGDMEENGLPSYPYIIIGNNQSNDTIQNALKIKDSSFPHYHSINSIGSSITLRSSDVKSGIVKSYDDGEDDFLQGNLIIINSDEILFNTRKDDIILSSGDQIRLGAVNDVFISSGANGTIRLGSKDPTTTVDPVVKYSTLSAFLSEFIDIVNATFSFLETNPNIAAINGSGKLESLKERLESIASKKVFID